MNCESESASHYAGCDCNEAHWQNEIARLTRERDEARERASSLSRELLDAIRARDSYRASAEIRVGMRREFEALLGCGDTMGDVAFAAGLARLRELVAGEKELAEFGEILSRHNHEWSERCELAESRAERLEKVLRASVVAMKRWSAAEDGLPAAPIGAYEAVAAAESIVGYVWASWGPDPTRAALGEEDSHV